jgi:HlyD family secretion protein
MISSPLKLGIILLALTATIGTAVLYNNLSNASIGASEYQLTTVRRGPMTKTVLASGKLRAVVTVDIGTQVSGMIKSLMADFNTEVKAGQVIARIDSAPFEARLSQAEAELTVARAQVAIQMAFLQQLEADLVGLRAILREITKELERLRSMFEQGGLPESAVDAALSNYEQSEAGVKAGLAQLTKQKAQIELAGAQVLQRSSLVEQRQLDLEYTYIRSSVDGVVISRNVDEGQTVAASLQTPVLFRIAQDLTHMEVYISVDEADIGYVQVGNQVVFTVDSYPQRNFTGRVHQIRKVGEDISNVVTYTVVATAENPDLELLPGMTANVKILIGERQDVLRVSNAALYFQPPGYEAPRDQGRQVWILDDHDKPKAIPVIVGISSGRESEVLEGALEEGQQVIMSLVRAPTRQ